MIEKLASLSAYIGNTPLWKLDSEKGEIYVKLEYNNLSGSIKDRAAFNILMEGIKAGLINPYTQIVESSSGNFGIALACICNQLGLDFIPVIDPNINPAYEKMLRLLVKTVVKVNQLDATGGYLLTRINTVREICSRNTNVFWPNQYENPNNYLAYYEGLGKELCAGFDQLDYLFIGVSSGGTITGTSRRVKEHFPAIKVIAVDVEGSLVFSNTPKKRNVSGIGASKRPLLLQEALIDDVVHVTEAEIIAGCHELLEEHTIFGGASAGAMYFAISKYFDRHPPNPVAKIVFLCPDKGTAYLDTVYNPTWVKKILPAPEPAYTLATETEMTGDARQEP